MYVRLFVLVAVLWASPIWGQNNDSSDGENRCDILGANCVCAEALNTNLSVESGSAPGKMNWKDPSDSVTKECSQTSNLAGRTIEYCDNCGATRIPVNNATMLDALPVGHQVEWAWGGPNFMSGVYFIGSRTVGSQFTKQLAARWYFYHSPDYEFDYEDGKISGVGCHNSKFMQFSGPNSLIDNTDGPIHMYNFTDFTPAQDCCSSGPGPENVTAAELRGKWWRFEAVYTNRAGPDWEFQLYGQPITDPGPERLIIDTTALGTQLNNPVSRTPPQRQDDMLVNMYRSDGTCSGFRAVSHYMLAGWDTDDVSHRIGPAEEVEGTLTVPTLSAALDCSAPDGTNSGSAPLEGVDCVVTPLLTGTGPDYRFELDCGGDGGTPEETIDIDDAVDPTDPQTFENDCDAVFDNSGTYYPTVTYSDFEDTEGVGTAVETDTASDTIVVNPSASQCPAEPEVPPTTSSGVDHVVLWDATNDGSDDDILDADFKSGDTMTAAQADCVAFQGVGNSYMTANLEGQASMEFIIDGVPQPECENNPSYSHPPDISELRYNCSSVMAAAAEGAHTLTVVPYDLNGCQGVAGPPKVVNFTIVP
jgi:hypothetical protein